MGGLAGTLGTAFADPTAMHRTVASVVATVLIGFVVPSGTVSAAESVAEHCPGYVGSLQRARASLVAGDRTSAIAALRDADAALAECIRRDSDEAGAQVLLAASPVAPRSITD